MSITYPRHTVQVRYQFLVESKAADLFFSSFFCKFVLFDVSKLRQLHLIFNIFSSEL